MRELPLTLRSDLRRAGGRVLLLSFVCGLAALTDGCSKRTQETINQREYAQYRGHGSATVEGQVTLTLPSGTELVGSACQVRLTPITSDSTRYIQENVMRGGTKPWKGDADSVWWLAQADQEGRFKFLEVPAGSYYVTCPVAWRDPTSGEARSRILWAEATAAPDETTTVSVSR